MMTYIFIDESGIFKDTEANKGPWSVVGALAIAKKDLGKLRCIVDGLPAQLGLAPGAEPKGRCFKQDQQVLAFVEQLKCCDPVFVPGILFQDESQAHLFEKLAAVDRQLPEEGKSVFASKSLQNYVQSNVLLDLMNAALWGSILRFSRTNPASLQAFTWIADQKEAIEDFVKVNLEEFISGYGHNFPHTIKPSPRMNLEPFYKANGAADRSSFSSRKVFGNFGFYDSKLHPGLQAADILSNAFRRCLRGYWDDPGAVARALGSLMVDQIPWLTIKSRDTGLKFNSTILPIADKFRFLTGAQHPIVERIRNRLPKR